MTRRILILSDIHLGCPRSRVRSPQALRPLWRDAAQVVINGDLAEVHDPRYRAGAARQTLELHDLCERDGVGLTLLSGNHDAYISDVRHLHLAGGQVFVTHGDVLHPAIAPWSSGAQRMRADMERALAQLEPASRGQLESRLAAAQHVAHLEWVATAINPQPTTVLRLLVHPISVGKLLHYWWTVPKLAADFAGRHAPAARYIVLGHTHRPGVWRVGPRTIVNTGSFDFPARPRAVTIDGDELGLWPIVLRRGLFERGAAPRVRLPLDMDSIERFDHVDANMAMDGVGGHHGCAGRRRAARGQTGRGAEHRRGSAGRGGSGG